VRLIAFAAGCAVLAAPALGNAVQDGEPIVTVRSEAELRPKTTVDRALADRFDTPWISEKLVPGTLLTIPCCEHPPPFPPPPWLEGLPVVPTRADPLGDVVCSTEAIAVGREVGRRTLFNKSETFLITVVTLEIWEWVRPASGPRRIELAFTGGVVRIGREMMGTKSGRLPDLRPVAVVFLRRIPGIDAYRSAADPLPLLDPSDSVRPEAASEWRRRHYSPVPDPMTVGDFRSASIRCRT
jgi:hypothetical protein